MEDFCVLWKILKSEIQVSPRGLQSSRRINIKVAKLLEYRTTICTQCFTIYLAVTNMSSEGHSDVFITVLFFILAARHRSLTLS